MASKPDWATHQFRNTEGRLVWFNPTTGQAMHPINKREVVLTRKTHYAFEKCQPIHK